VITVNNADLIKLMSDLSKMDKKDLQESLLKASKILGADDTAKIVDAFKKD